MLAAVKRKLSATPLNIPAYSMASIENASQQQRPVHVQPLEAAARVKACMAGVTAVLAQPLPLPVSTLSTQQRQGSLLPDGGRLLGR